jgi:hypothetical protein
MFIGSYTRQQPGRFVFPQVETDDAPTAYQRVLNLAGHSLVRDAVDTRVISEVRSETGHHIDSENQVGGWPTLNSSPAPLDTDQDGIPDAWENDHGLNPFDPADGPAIMPSGYSNLELYLNDIVPVPDADKDHIAPATLATLSQLPNAAGWNNNDLTVTLNATDNEDGSGVRELFYTVNGTPLHALGSAVSIPVTTEGLITITFFARDKAGNSEAPQSLTVKLDKTAPSFSNLSRTAPNANGWNNTDVDSSFTATDSLSGLASGATESGTFTFTQEGASQVHTFTVSDLAGNSASADISNVNIDKTRPIISAVADPALNANGWNNTNVTVSFNSSDTLSGIDSSSGPVNLTNDGAGQVVTGTAVDRAGNTASVSRSINIDKTPPIIGAVASPGPNANGWNNTNVTVSFNSSDTLSGIDSSSGPVTLTNEGAGQVVTGTAKDRAGNSATVSLSINIDKTAPEAFIQFDPVNKKVLVFGRDMLPPSGHREHGDDDDDDDGGMEQRTYRVLDRAGNTVTLVLSVKVDGHEVKAKVVSLQYNSGPIVSAPKNKLDYEWETDRNGNLKQLEQQLKINSGNAELQVDAEFKADRNQTVIKTKHPNATIIKPGLVLLRLASV